MPLSKNTARVVAVPEQSQLQSTSLQVASWSEKKVVRTGLARPFSYMRPLQIDRH